MYLFAVGLATLDYVILIAYLLAVLLIGAWFRGGGIDTETYLLGGRQMRWWLVGISYTVTFLSAISLVGVPGEAYKNGMTAALWPILGLCLSIGFFFIFIRFYFTGPTFTPFEYLERRFGMESRAMTAGIYCLARALYLGTVLFATAKVFQGLVDWPLVATILLVGTVTVAYTTMGGIRAVVWTDLMQFVVLTGGLSVIVSMAIMNSPGGVIDVFRFAHESDHLFPDFSNPEFYSLSPYVRLTLWTLIIRAIGDHLFYKSADQILIQRMLATSSYWHAFRCTVLGSALAATTVFCLYFVGLSIFQFYAQFPVAERPAPDLALFTFIADHLPTPLAGIVVAGVVAAVMSTVDSGVNSLSTVVTKDFYLRFWRPHATEQDQIDVSRRMTIAWGALIIGLALVITALAEGVEGTVLESAGIWMSLLLILSPIFLLGVLSRRARQRHAILALAAGILTTIVMIVWYYTMKGRGEEVGFHMVAVSSFLATLLVAFLCSFFAHCIADEKLANLTLWTLRSENQSNKKVPQD